MKVNLIQTLDRRNGGTGLPSVVSGDGYWVYTNGPLNPFVTTINDVPNRQLLFGSVISDPNSGKVTSTIVVCFDQSPPGIYCFEYVTGSVVGGVNCESRTKLEIRVTESLLLTLNEADSNTDDGEDGDTTLPTLVGEPQTNPNLPPGIGLGPNPQDTEYTGCLEYCLIKQFSTEVILTPNSLNFSDGLPFVGPISWQWYQDNKALFGETSEVLNILLENPNPKKPYQTKFLVRGCTTECGDATASVCVLLSPYINAGDPVENVKVCEGEQRSFDVTTLFKECFEPDCIGVTEEWIDKDGLVNGNNPGDMIPTPNNTDISGAAPGTYCICHRVVYTFPSGETCEDESEACIEVLSAGNPGLNGTITVCNGCQNLDMSLQDCDSPVIPPVDPVIGIG